MISTEKLDASFNIIDTSINNTSKQNKWNEQPHIGKYKLIKTIGKGNFAKVKLAQHVTTNKKVAVKVIDKTALNNSSLQKLFREVKIMKTLEHPNIVKLFEVIESERHVYLVMEYASRGEVFDFLVQNGRMKEKEARQRFREIVSAIQYCHQKNIVHRDLKAENLLLSSDLEIKIADFGFANNFDGKKQLDTFCGSPPYAAPELFQGRKYDGPEVDVWSLGVILYTLVSGSLPFDGHNMRELRERVLRGKYRIPFYMSTDCELLLKKMLIVNPQKRYTLLEVMKDRWINIGYEDRPLQPYKEPARNYEDPVRISIMENLGFSKDEILDSLYNAKFNNVTATYLLLGDDVNNGLENSSKSASVSSLKNMNTLLSPKDTEEANSPGKGVTRSGSALESRLNKRVATNGDSKDLYNTSHTDKQAPIADEENTNPDMSLKVKPGKMASNIKQSPSMGTTNPYSNEEHGPQLTNASFMSRHNPIRIPGIQGNTTAITSILIDDKTEMSNGDNLLMPTKTNNWVKRNNTFTYADKNTTSDIESKPVTRTKHVMNMLSSESQTTTQSTMPTTLDQSFTIGSTEYGSNDVIIKDSKNQDSKIVLTHRVADESAISEATVDKATMKINDQPTATGDKLCVNTLSSNDETIHNGVHNPLIVTNDAPEVITSVNNSVASGKDANDPYPHLNRPKAIHSNSLFRSFTNKISSSKLIRRLTSHHNPSANPPKRSSDNEASNSTDPWTPMDTTIVSNDKRKVSVSSDLTGDKHSPTDKAHHTYTLKPNQNKPRLMHLVFRKNLTSKLRPDTIISETLKTLLTVDEIEFKKMEQIDNFVIECHGRLKSEQGGNELIQWEIEVFRLSRSSSLGIRIKKQSGSSTRFKAIQKLLINRLSPVLSVCPGN